MASQVSLRYRIDAAHSPEWSAAASRPHVPGVVVVNGPAAAVKQHARAAPTAARRLLAWHELPAWQQGGTQLIETGYRDTTPSVLRCFYSWFYLHNETVNIFSHLVGAGVFLALPSLLWRELSARYHDVHASAADVVVFAAYLAGVATCYTLSVVFHTLFCHSAAAARFGVQLDFVGIVALVWSANAPLVYYSFRLYPRLRIAYWSLTSFCAILASIVTFTPVFHRPDKGWLRAGVFGSLGLSNLACVAHGVLLHGWQRQSELFPMRSIGWTLAFNSIGAGLYVFRFPERFWRRRFDIFGSSHQLMHCAIVVASLVWLVGMMEAFETARAETL